MLTVREFRESDMNAVKLIHERYYHNLTFPRFLKYLCSFVITENNEIVMAGGFEAVSELVLTTNQDQPRVVIGRALVEAKRVALYLAEKFNVGQVYAFTDNDVLAKHIKKHGFVSAPTAYNLRTEYGPK